MTRLIWQCTDALTSWWVFLPLFALAVYFWLALFPKLPVKSFDSRGYFDPRGAENILLELGEEGRAKYLRAERTVDLWFPIIYSTTFAIALNALGKSLGAPRWLVLVPFVAAVFDYVENSCVITMLLRYGDGKPPGAFAYICAVATPLKSVLFVASWVMPVLMAAIWLFRRFGR